MGRPSPDRLAVLCLAILAILVVGPALMPGHAFVSIPSSVRRPFDAGLTQGLKEELEGHGNFETGDQLFQVLPEREAFFGRLRRGEIPLWWREAGGGISLMGAPGGEFTEPRVLLFSWLFGSVGALAPLAALTIFSLASLSYLFFRLRDATPLAAATGGLVFALSGALASNLFYVCKVDSLILLPAGLAALELWVRGRRLLAFALAALAAADSALASFPQNTATVFYVLLLLGAWRLRGWGREAGAAAWRGGAILGIAVILGIGVAAWHLLPVVDWGRQSDRPFTLAGGGYATTPTQLASLVAPFALGDPTSPLAQQWNPVPDLLPSLGPYSFTESTLYIGLAGLALAIAGALRGRRALVPIVGFLFSLAIAMGTPVAWLPGVGVSAPSRALAIASFFLAWLAAEGLDGLRDEARARRGAILGIAILGITALGAVALRATWDGAAVGKLVMERRTAAAARAVPPAAPPAPLVEAMAAERWSKEVRPELWRIAAWGALGAAALGLALARPRARGLLAFLAVADLALFTVRVTPPQPRRPLLPDNPTIAAVRDAAAGGRIVRIAPGGPITPADFELFQATLPPLLGIADTAAYVVMPNAAQASAIRAFFPDAKYPNVIFLGTYFTALPAEALSSPLLDLLGATVVLSRAPLAAPGLEPVASREGFLAYRRVHDLGRAWIVPKATWVESPAAAAAALADPNFDPRRAVILEGSPPSGGDGADGAAGGGAVTIADPNNHTVEVSVRGSGGGYLFLTDAMAPGWTAFLDGAPAPAFRANRSFRAVRVPPGDHRIVWSYWPPSFAIGAALSLASIIGIVGIALALRRSARAA
jgi:hypothetical protein